jgi:hypothetical protein
MRHLPEVVYWFLVPALEVLDQLFVGGLDEDLGSVVARVVFVRQLGGLSHHEIAVGGALVMKAIK